MNLSTFNDVILPAFFFLLFAVYSAYLNWTPEPAAGVRESSIVCRCLPILSLSRSVSRVEAKNGSKMLHLIAGWDFVGFVGFKRRSKHIKSSHYGAFRYSFVSAWKYFCKATPMFRKFCWFVFSRFRRHRNFSRVFYSSHSRIVCRPALLGYHYGNSIKRKFTQTWSSLKTSKV